MKNSNQRYQVEIKRLMESFSYHISQWGVERGNKDRKQWGEAAKREREIIALIAPKYFLSDEFIEWHANRCESWKYPNYIPDKKKAKEYLKNLRKKVYN